MELIANNVHISLSTQHDVSFRWLDKSKQENCDRQFFSPSIACDNWRSRELKWIANATISRKPTRLQFIHIVEEKNNGLHCIGRIQFNFSSCTMQKRTMRAHKYMWSLGMETVLSPCGRLLAVCQMRDLIKTRNIWQRVLRHNIERERENERWRLKWVNHRRCEPWHRQNDKSCKNSRPEKLKTLVAYNSTYVAVDDMALVTERKRIASRGQVCVRVCVWRKSAEESAC